MSVNLDVDDLGADIAAALDTPSPVHSPGDAAPPSEGAAPPPGDKPSEGERARDESGRFKAKEDEPAAAKDATPETAKALETAKAPEQTQVPAADRIAPPQHWKGTGKVSWEKLPKTVQQEIVNDYQGYGELNALKAAVAPYEQNLKLGHGSVEGGIKNILSLVAESQKNPTGFLLWFAQQNGINLAQIVGAQGQAQGQQQQPQPQAIQQPQNIEALIAAQVEQQSRKVIAQRDIESFASSPNHPYFNDVRPLMATIMQAGQASTIQEAYDAACYARPDIRQQLLSQQAEKERTEAAQRNGQSVANAKKAAGTSLTGSPAGAITPPDGPEHSLEAEITKQVNARF